MQLTESLTMMKALADPSRLLLLNALLDQPQYVEALAERLQLAVSTVSFHLKKLEAAKLVCKVKEQYYAMYSVNRDALQVTLADLVAVNDIHTQQQAEHLQQYRMRVLRTFFQDGRLIQLPIQKKKRRMILEELAARFEAGRTYAEAEVNAIITAYYADYCTIRRELVEEQLLAREQHTYWVVTVTTATALPPMPTRQRTQEGNFTMNSKAALKRAYKEHPRPAGIFQITNTLNGKILLGKGLDVRGILNGQQAQLKWGSHRNHALQQDWNRVGAAHFTFAIVDELERTSDPQQDVRKDLAALEELWLEKLQPYGEKGYNALPKKRAQPAVSS